MFLDEPRKAKFGDRCMILVLGKAREGKITAIQYGVAFIEIKSLARRTFTVERNVEDVEIFW